MLPKGATPLDFAYRVHTGDRPQSAAGPRLNGGIVALKLYSADREQGEIITRQATAARADWLNANLGYVNYLARSGQGTALGSSRQGRASRTSRAGKLMLDRELTRLALNALTICAP